MQVHYWLMHMADMTIYPCQTKIIKLEIEVSGFLGSLG